MEAAGCDALPGRADAKGAVRRPAEHTEVWHATGWVISYIQLESPESFGNVFGIPTWVQRNSTRPPPLHAAPNTTPTPPPKTVSASPPLKAQES